MTRNLSDAQEASALYFTQQLTPLTTLEEINAKVAAIHLEPGRAPGPDCGCNDCVMQHGPLGPVIPDAAPPSEVPPEDEPGYAA